MVVYLEYVCILMLFNIISVEFLFVNVVRENIRGLWIGSCFLKFMFSYIYIFFIMLLKVVLFVLFFK